MARIKEAHSATTADSETVAAHNKQGSEEPKTGDAEEPGAVTGDSKIAAAQKKDDVKVVDTVDSDDVNDEPAADTRRLPANAEPRRISVSVRTLLVAMLTTGVVAAVGVLAWLYIGARAKLDEQQRQTADNSHAERIALDYAVDAARIDAKNLDAWKKNLVKGTTPELKAKLNEAGKSMEQILTPLQWDSTAVPLVAKVRSSANGIYVVDTFVGVQTKTVQAPDGLQSTATYGITIDSNHGWQISDVGGIGSVVGQK
jgi:Mce-associated membrane protein